MPDDLPDPEWLAFESGVKPALRLSLPAAVAADRQARLSRDGFSVVAAERTVQWAGQSEQSILYVSRDAAISQALRDAEAPVFPGVPSKLTVAQRQDAHRRVGALLGFPSCCVAAFLERVERGVTRRAAGGEASEDYVAAEDAATRTHSFHGRLNDLRRRERLWLIPFYPCRYDCEAALAYADGVFTEMQRRAPVASDELRTALSRPVTLPVPVPLTIPFDRF